MHILTRLFVVSFTPLPFRFLWALAWLAAQLHEYYLLISTYSRIFSFLQILIKMASVKIFIVFNIRSMSCLLGVSISWFSCKWLFIYLLRCPVPTHGLVLDSLSSSLSSPFWLNRLNGIIFFEILPIPVATCMLYCT